MTSRIDVPTLRAALWAYRALGQVRRQLRRGDLQHLHVTPAPRLPRWAGRGVSAVLRRRDTTCLEQALVIQRWKMTLNEPVDVIIGIRSGEEFGAHAWIDGDTASGEDFEELLRVSPP